MPESIATSAASVREETRRHEMVDRFVAPRGVTDARVLAAMRQVPRHLFVPEPLRSKAFTEALRQPIASSVCAARRASSSMRSSEYTARARRERTAVW